MSTEAYVSIGSLIIAGVSMVTSFILQHDAKKVRELESKNTKQREKLRKALRAIKGYQQIEERYATEDGMSVKTYRTLVRKANKELFDSGFLSPGKVDEMLNDLEE